MLTNQSISEQLAQITNAKRITIYVGINEYHAMSMNGLNQTMKFEGHDVVVVRLQSYFRIEVEYEKNIAKLTVSIDASEARRQLEELKKDYLLIPSLIKEFIRDVTYIDKDVAYVGYREDAPLPNSYFELVKKAWED